MTDEAAHNDVGKARLDLLDADAMYALGNVLLFGEQKYGATNWRKGMAWSKLVGSALRHIFARMRGERLDAESGLPHLAHAMCCLMFLLSYETHGNGTNDLPHG